MPLSRNERTTWEPWLTELEQAAGANDTALVRASLRDLWRFDFRGHRGTDRDAWGRLFRALLRLLDNEAYDVSAAAYHYALRVVMAGELAPPYAPHTIHDAREGIEARTRELIEAIPSLASRDAHLVLRLTDDLAHVEALAGVGAQRTYRDWLAALPLEVPTRAAAEISYVLDRAPWLAVRDALFAYLDDDDVLVRAYAARAIGRHYCGLGAESLTPSLREVVTLITKKEIARPGIAGPLLSPWYGDGEALSFERAAGVALDDWFCEILACRAGPEPDTLPCADGIDHFAHEIFGGRPELIRKLVSRGAEAVAIDVATRVRGQVEGLERVLSELVESPSDAISSAASHHLAFYYRNLHPEGVRRGFVKPAAPADVDIFFAFEGAGEKRRPFAAAVYPKRVHFDDAAAWRWVDELVPPELGGARALRPVPKETKPGDATIGEPVWEFERGAIVTLRGDPKARRWSSIVITWRGAPSDWAVARCAR